MVALKKLFDTNPQLPVKGELTWETSLWRRKTQILYEGEFCGYLRVKGVFKPRAVGEFLGRTISIHPINFWSTSYVVRDETGEEDIALLNTMRWSDRAKLTFNNGEAFVWKQDVWGRGSWWWQKTNEKGKPERDSVKAKVSEYIVAKRGSLQLSNTEDENLNAMIMGGLFARILKDQGQF
ncbi:hypothetical protein R9C00_11185 [Flammeovirgaceae bacterium SG7u.111]|nr:hypothetical protein [Flammeovirgaceae bacterium SG7u.132]WPO38015.1 hypothetical protein R9C00_11185 [Flammeovirgaceae bacterium SG7u.111]